MAFDAKFDKLIIDSIDTATGIDKTTGEILFIHDEIKSGTIENAGDLSFGTGAHGKRVSSLQSNKTAKVTYQNAYVVASSLATKIGATIEEADADNKFVVPDVQFVTVAATGSAAPTATLPKTPTTGSVKFVYIANKDMSAGKKLELTTDFTVSGATITFVGADSTYPVTAGDVVIAVYEYESTVGKKISNDAEKYSKNCKLILDLLLRDVCDNSQIYHAKMVLFNVVPDMNDTITIGDEPAVEDFSAEAIIDPCATSKLYWDLYIVE